MAKSYAQFKPEDLDGLGIVLRNGVFMQDTPNLEPSDLLVQVLRQNQGLPMGSEKARSEHIIAPILNEMRYRNLALVNYFSGYTLDVDGKRGLRGRCDFILSLDPTSLTIAAPLFCVVEVKSDTPDDDSSIAQCVAEMYAAQLFNRKHGNSTIFTMYGAVSNGFEWVFISLIDNIATADLTHRYHIDNLPRLLGKLQAIIDLYK